MEGIRENYAIVARLHHSAISGLRNLEKDPDFGEYYLVMDLAQGEDLSTILRRRRGTPMALGEALDILRPLASALDYAHGERVLHRDVKPANVKVETLVAGKSHTETQRHKEGGATSSSEPHVQLLDFGLAAEVRSSMSRMSLRGHAGSSGTPAYMAPEQWEAKRQSAATDQYSLAVMAYQMLAGYLPFDADDMALLKDAVLTRPPEEIEGVPAHVNAALMRALAKNPKERFASCAEFVKFLQKRETISPKPPQDQPDGMADDEDYVELQEMAGGALQKAEKIRRYLAKPHPLPPRRGAWLWWGAALVAIVFAHKSISRIYWSWVNARHAVEQAKAEWQKMAHKTGESKVVCVGSQEIALRWCPATTSEDWKRISGGKDFFMMGSPSSEEGRDNDETQHRVTLTKGFWMGETEVTQGLWKYVMGSNPSYFKSGDDYPVEQVSWYDCQEFLKKLNARSPQSGLRWDLPTEAQWEYACRAGTTGMYGGSGHLDDMGWYDGNSGNKPRPVKQKRPNDWGLYDMHGNVWEWCQDRHGNYPSDAVTDPTSAASGDCILRGGSCWFASRICRSANRYGHDPSPCGWDDGFRVALVSAD